MKPNRMNRINFEIQKHLAEIISKLDDENLSSSIISILKIETFADLSLSKIYISVLGSDEKKYQIVDKLNNNKKTIRYNLAHKMNIRTIPDLLFIADEFEKKSQRILKLFEEIEGESDER